MNTVFKTVLADNILAEAQRASYEGWHLVQQCATRVEGGYELIYTFGRDYDLDQWKITIGEDENVESITPFYPCAFIYENEMHDLFGVKIKMIQKDYAGRLYRTATPTPFK